MCAQKEAMKRQGTRMKTTSCQNGTKYRDDHGLASQVGASLRNVQHFIRLTELIPELLEMVGNKRIGFVVGLEPVGKL